jgi:O-antigen chain-terminating methyltransferase
LDASNRSPDDPLFERTVSADDLARLKREREAADAAYNQTLTLLDGTVQHLREMPSPGPPYDEHQVTPLNERWDLLAVKPPDRRGWKGKMQSFVWAVVSPLFERQHSFNSALVDHVNRNIRIHRDATASVTAIVSVMREELAKTVEFQARLIKYAQAVTPYVDTKDREVGGLMRRINEDVAEVNESLSRRIIGLAGTLGEVTDELRRRWESTMAGHRRLEARVGELRSTSAVAHQVSQTLKRELERIQQIEPSRGQPTARGSSPPATGSTDVTSALDSYKYVGFEDIFRGSHDDIRARLESYLPYFKEASDVLDGGCGRGEFLEILRDHNVTGRGIDINHEMVEQCRERGLTVEEVDLLTHLSGLPDGSLGGLFAAQVVEHLEPAYLLKVLDAAFHTLRPGARIILETINVASWSAFFQSYVRDITHVRPLHPETLRYLVIASGFQEVDVVYRSPCLPQNRLEAIPPLSDDAKSSSPPALAQLVVAFNENVEKLNGLMFADQDYAIIGERP